MVTAIVNEIPGHGAIPGKLMGSQVASEFGFKLRLRSSFVNLRLGHG